MIDLDCALFNPVHCQTLLESDDNTFGTIVLEPDLPEPIEIPIYGFAYVPSDVILVAQNSRAQDLPGSAPPTSLSRQRPPPWKTLT